MRDVVDWIIDNASKKAGGLKNLITAEYEPGLLV